MSLPFIEFLVDSMIAFASGFAAGLAIGIATGRVRCAIEVRRWRNRMAGRERMFYDRLRDDECHN